MIHAPDMARSVTGNATYTGDCSNKTRRARIACEAVAVACAVPVAELMAASRRAPRIAWARQVAMYLAHITFGISLADVGREFGRDRTTVAHACRVVEQRRDDPNLDNALTRLEHRIRAREQAAAE